MEIMTIGNVHAYLDNNGTAWLNAEDVARGLGFTQTKNGIEYVRWETVNNYLSDFGFSQQVGKENFLPENIFYRLAMKAKNEAAEKFQTKVADEILPAIRKHGFYGMPMTIEAMLNNPDLAIQLLQAFKTERAEKEHLRNIVEVQSVQIAELTPKADYCDLILQSPEAVPISVIAKDYGYSAKAMNKLLHELNIQYKLAGGTWLVYQTYAKEGYNLFIGEWQLTNSYAKRQNVSV